MSYQAITTSGGTIAIGDFPDLNAAKVWALQEYGANVSDVIEVPTITVSAHAIDPAWYLLGAAGLLLLLASQKKKPKRKRGTYVSR
jgi:hypothetical protein